VLTKTRQPELHRYWTTRDRAANVRLYRLAAEILAAVVVGVLANALSRPRSLDSIGPALKALRTNRFGPRLVWQAAEARSLLH
jgi:hypothetical protein